MKLNRQRSYAALLFLGATVLLYRAIAMITEGAVIFLVPWVSTLLLVECGLDAFTLVASLRWWATGRAEHARVPLRAGAAVAILHAFRVLIFVMGRTGPWVDFDVRPEHRAMHFERWTWGEVHFAAVLSTLGVLAVLVIWRYRRRAVRQRPRY